MVMVETHEDEHTGHHQHQPKNRKFEFSRVETLCKYTWIRVSGPDAPKMSSCMIICMLILYVIKKM